MTFEDRVMKKLQKISAAVLKREGKSRFFAHIRFVGPTEMRALNRTYRGKNKSTDVLSFNEIDDAEPNYIGVILLCRSYLRTQAREFDVSYEEELMRMTIHGTLHLIGYDHMTPRDAKKMLPRQEKYLEHFVYSI